MPIYEYQCTKCGHQLEALQKMSDAPLTECPECHNPTLTKLISETSFQLKGTGWYATDFRDKGKQQQKTTEKSTDTTTGSTSTDSTTKGSSSDQSKT